ncbi:MAG: D-alanyl-lipoteichoic acid biosynthesis protein DltD [Candidatus Sumerlaeia bacterium]|nr:D-alanyl-lipoteichoic acid biosynthesis protein DltD [Candidatus Sumerlaeia bacterium]
MNKTLRGLRPFLFALPAVLAAEGLVRLGDALRLFPRPTKTGLIYMDEKRDAFLNRFLPQAEHPGVLILGSSTADTNLDPVTVEAVLAERGAGSFSIFNGALYGTRTADNLHFLEWYRRHWRYERVVINIEPGILRPGSMLEGLMRAKLDKNRVEWWLMDHSALFRYRDQVKFRHEGENLRSTFLAAFDAETTSHGWNRTLAVTQYIQRDEQVRGIAAPMRQWTTDYSNIERMAEFCAANGIDLTFVSLPWRPDMMEHLPGPWSFDEITRQTREIAERHGVRYLDLSRVEFPDEMFFDASHLNGYGARELSILFADRYARMLREGAGVLVEPGGEGPALLREAGGGATPPGASAAR